MSIPTHKDPGTGLLTTTAFYGRVADGIRGKQGPDEPAGLAVLSVHLDRLLEQEQAHGGETATLITRAAAERLNGCVREGDVVSLAETGRFRILLDPLQSAELAASLAEKICQVLRLPFAAHGRQISLSASVGISLYPHDSATADGLIRLSDRSMQMALTSGDCYQFNERGLAASLGGGETMDDGPRHALHTGQFELHYQPRVDLETGRVRSGEALIRWPHPLRGMIPPSAFIPLAESTGLIHEIGAWTLDRACSDARRWQEEMDTPVGVSVNVSGRQLDHPEFPLLVERILERTGLPPQSLELELTESAIMRRPEDATVTLHRLRSLGVRIALDDFGTGHSSLAYLRRFPLDVLKIDRSFVHDLSASDGNAVLLRSIIDLAHALHLRVVAEGVETPEQRRILTEHGCDEIQGFLICSAVPVDQFTQGLITTMRPRQSTVAESAFRAR